MPMFVRLTRDGTNESVHVNLDAVRSFERRPNINYTVLDFGAEGESFAVSETPDEIHAKIFKAQK